jgi:endonuclease/exonuclease/phosphatase (EEP) superfamily protein YafD
LALVTAYIVGLGVYLVCRTIFGDNYWWLGMLNEFAWYFFLLLPITFILSLLLKNRPAFGGNLLLIAVLLIWFGPGYLPNNPPPPTRTTVKIVTFNVWIYNEQLAAVNAWLEEMEPDFVLLQEITSGLADGEDSLNNRFPYQVSKTSTTENFGTLLLSRHPILSETPLSSLEDFSLHRYTLDVNGRIIALYNAHMPQPIGESHFSFSHDNLIVQNILSYDNTRRNEEIRNLLRRIEKEEYPYIIAGDFNMSDQTVIYGEISAEMTDSFREAGTGSGNSWPVLVLDHITPLIPPLLRVDYIWHSQEFRTVEAFRGPELGSDHLPLVAELELLE